MAVNAVTEQMGRYDLYLMVDLHALVTGLID